MSSPTTFVEAFQRTALRQPDALALRVPGDRIRLTWGEYAAEVRRIAGGLRSLGVRPGDAVAAMLTNRPEFHLSETAAGHVGATTFSMYNTSSVEQINYLLEHSGARVVITERQFAEKVRAARGPVEHVLVIEDGDLDRLEPDPDFDFETSWRAVQPDDVLCLIYTSGTTGPPKGVELTHAAALAVAESMATVFDYRAGDRGISYLPASHIADRFMNQYCALLHGIEVTCLDDPTALPAALFETQPTVFAAVPRVWEKIKFGVERQLQANPALEAGFSAGAPQVLSAVRAKLGLSELRWALSGAASIAPEVYAFLNKLGVPVTEVWGMSECGMATGATPAMARPGTVGPLLAGYEGRIAADGELLVRGRALMRGYRNAPAATAEAIDSDGWLHTGDIFTSDADGHLTIIDRKKELIVNAAGKNMSPSNIQNAIRSSSPLMGSVFVVGDARPYNVALITLDPDAAAAFGEEHGLDASPEVLVKDDRIIDAIQAGVDAGNARLSRVEQVKRFTLLPTYWMPGGDELTPTVKLRRKPTAAKYEREIEELYRS